MRANRFGHDKRKGGRTVLPRGSRSIQTLTQEITHRNPFILNPVNRVQFLKAWEDQGQAKITLKVDSEKELYALQKEAKKVGLVAVVIQDAGKTQILAGSSTVLVVGPGMHTFPVELQLRAN